MKYYYDGYSCVGWIPNEIGDGGKWRKFSTDQEYKEAYENRASLSYSQ